MSVNSSDDSVNPGVDGSGTSRFDRASASREQWVSLAIAAATASLRMSAMRAEEADHFDSDVEQG